MVQVSTVASQQNGCRLRVPGLGSHRTFSLCPNDSLPVLRIPPTVQKHACEANWEFYILIVCLSVEPSDDLGLAASSPECRRSSDELMNE